MQIYDAELPIAEISHLAFVAHSALRVTSAGNQPSV